MRSRLRRLACKVKGHDPVPMRFHASDFIPAVRCTRCHRIWHGPGRPTVQ